MGETIAVTGGSGFIAAWMIKTLLEKGYIVTASVLDLNDPKEVDHLVALDGAKERLTLFKANLLDEGSFDSLIEGADGVFHMASPFFFETKNPQVELLDPALKGTLNVLRSVAKTPSVKRVVLTSSEAVTTFNYTQLRPDLVVDETWWSDVDYLTENKHLYLLSKTIAEEAAWKFCKEKGIDMVTVNPAAVLGPLLHARLIYKLINGKETFPNETCGFVNVKDFVVAHILAYETPSVIEGADGVFHMAAPFFFETKNPLVELLDPALKGTFNVLHSVAKTLSVKRVVLTSSEAATTFNYTQLRPDLVVHETWWSDVDYLTEYKVNIQFQIFEGTIATLQHKHGGHYWISEWWSTVYFKIFVLSNASSTTTDIEKGVIDPDTEVKKIKPLDAAVHAFCYASGISLLILNSQNYKSIPLSVHMFALFVVGAFWAILFTKFIGGFANILERVSYVFTVFAFTSSITIFFPPWGKIICWIIFLPSTIAVFKYGNFED